MKKIIAGLLILVSLSVYAKDDYVLCSASSDRESNMYFSKRVIKSIDYRYNCTYLVWVKINSYGNTKKGSVNKIVSYYKRNKLDYSKADDFAYTIQLYLIDIEEYKIKYISDKVFYNIKGKSMLAEDSDASGKDWIYITPRSDIFGLISDIKKYVHK